MYAVLETGGKQYKVSLGDTLEVEKLFLKVGESVTFDKVLLLVDDNSTQIGTPYLPNTSVEAEVIAQVKGGKIRVAKFKAKVRYRRTTGHRQHLTKLNIKKITTEKIPKKSSKSLTPKLTNR